MSARVAIIGAGHIAEIHAPVIRAQPGYGLEAIADPDLARARALAARLDIRRVYGDAQRMLEDCKPDVVHVLTPPQQHAGTAILAMQHGCHVLVEKPLALKADDARRMIETAAQNNVRLCVSHNMAYENTIRKALDRALSGELGKLVEAGVDMVFDPNRTPSYTEEGAEQSHWIYGLNGGPLQDLMPHPVSILLELMGPVIEQKHIGARMGRLPEGWDDEIRVLLRSEDMIGRIGISLSEKPDTMLVSISGTRGRIVADPFSGTVTVQKHSCLPRAAVRGLLGFRLAGQYALGALLNAVRFVFGRIDKTNGIAPVVRRFYSALRDECAPPVSDAQALQSVEIMDRIWPQRQGPPLLSLPAPDSLPGGPVALVTGASGFVGTHLVRRLVAAGKRVRVLVRRNSLHSGRLKSLPVEWVQGELSDRESVRGAVEGAEIVYHLGGAMSNNWDEHEAATINGTRHVVDAAVEFGVKKLLFTSTLAVYELLELEAGTLINEDCAYQKDPRRFGPYAWAKIEAEKIVLEAARERGLDAAIVRLGMVLGPLCRVFYPHLGYKLGTDLFLPIGSGDLRLPLVYVDNAVDGMIGAAQNDRTGGRVYNLVDEDGVSVNRFLDTFLSVTGASSRIVHMPYALAWLLTLAYEAVSGVGLIKKGATSRAQLKWKQSDMRYDASRARNEFGWQPKVSQDEGLQRTFRWYADRYGV